MQSLISYLGGAGLAAIVGAISAVISQALSRNQHQKDVTVGEIRKCKESLNNLNNEMIDNYGNSDMVQYLKAELLSYLASWSVNIKYHRVSRRMVAYSMHHILYQQLEILNKDLPSNYHNFKYHGRAKKVIYLFKQCDIISSRKW